MFFPFTGNFISVNCKWFLEFHYFFPSTVPWLLASLTCDIVHVQKMSKRVNFVKGLIREVAGFAPYEKRITELLKSGKDKRALKVAKRKLGTHKRAKKKINEMANVFRKKRYAFYDSTLCFTSLSLR